MRDSDDLPAQVEILISSKSALQLTITKTSLSVFNELMSVYQEDISMLTKSKTEVDAIDIAPETQEPLFFFENQVRSDDISGYRHAIMVHHALWGFPFVFTVAWKRHHCSS